MLEYAGSVGMRSTEGAAIGAKSSAMSAGRTEVGAEVSLSVKGREACSESEFSAASANDGAGGELSAED